MTTTAPAPPRNPALALLADCWFCGAKPGEPCRSKAWGFAMKVPHYTRGEPS